MRATRYPTFNTQSSPRYLRGNHLLRLFALAGLLVSGCKEKPEGPKRADNEAAHAHHFHPDVPRSTITGSRPAEAETRPAATQFADLFEIGVVGSPVLFVNNQTVSTSEILEPIIEDLRKQSKVQDDRQYTDTVLTAIRNQIDYQVSTILVYEEAKAKYSDKKFQEAFDKRVEQLVKDIIDRSYGGVRARYETHLKALDYTPADVKERLKREAIKSEYLRDRFRPMLKDPSRRELLRYYEEHRTDFTTREKAELFLIEVPIASELKKPLRDATPQEREAALARARDRIKRAREELDSGVDFATVARAYSRGSSANQGGAWGEIEPGSLTQRWAKAGEVLFTLKPDQMSVVETDEFVFLVRCGKKTPAHQASFEQAQRGIMEKLEDEQFAQLRTDYIRGLMGRATIKKRTEFVQALLAVVPRPSRAPADRKLGFGE